MRHWTLVYLAIAGTGMPRRIEAQRFDSTTTDTVTPGVIHHRLFAAAGPWNINVLEIDLRRRDLSIRAAHAGDMVRGRELTSATARRHSSDTATVVAAVNADFFSLKTGEAENNEVVEGLVRKARLMRALPVNPRTQFAFTRDGHALIDRLVFRGTLITSAGVRLTLGAINDVAGEPAVVLYTARYGANDPWDPSEERQVIRVRRLRTAGDTTVYQVASFPFAAGTARLFDTDALTFDSRGHYVLAPGDTIRVVAEFLPASATLRTLVGGWPRLVVHGQSIADSADRLEGTNAAFSVTRHPRTGIGMSRDSSTLYLITVDGRQESSSGVSLVEFANLMLSLGVYEGLNLDGGGSTTMVINGTVVNHPSDPAGERTVGNALLVVRSRHE